MVYYLVKFNNDVVLYDKNDNKIEEINSLNDFENWQKDKTISLIVVSDSDIEIKGNFLPYSEELELKKQELEESYPNMVTIYYQESQKIDRENIIQKEIKEKEKCLECKELYIIEYFNDYVTTKNYKKNIILKKEGEEKFKFDNEYWQWFKDKIDYDDEILCFVIVTDKEEFQIDKTIKIGNKNNFNIDLSKYKNSNFFVFPKIETPKKKTNPIKTKKHSELAQFMINKLKG